MTAGIFLEERVLLVKRPAPTTLAVFLRFSANRARSKLPAEEGAEMLKTPDPHGPLFEFHRVDEFRLRFVRFENLDLPPGELRVVNIGVRLRINSK